MHISKKIKLLRTEHDLTQEELGKIAGVTNQAVSAWEKGDKEPKVQPLQKICAYFGLDISSFIDEKNDYDAAVAAKDLPDNILPMPKMNKIPLLGTIACGEPILAAENIDDEIDIPENIHADFALRCKGDSMVNDRINDGDIVYIRIQPSVNNGEIAAVLIEDEATLKHVYIRSGSVILQPANPDYEPIVLAGEELNTVRVLGKAVGFTSPL